jgi:hypothetical protein
MIDRYHENKPRLSPPCQWGEWLDAAAINRFVHQHRADGAEGWHARGQKRHNTTSLFFRLPMEDSPIFTAKMLFGKATSLTS